MTRVIGLDTNILLRYYISDAADKTTERQRTLARQIIESGDPLAVCKTVILEFEWVLRGYYKLPRMDVNSALQHLLQHPHIQFEDRRAIELATAHHAAGLDFADALHHASYGECAQVASFDDRGFARRGGQMKLKPPVKVPGRPRG
jgi:predicted nucleic-acid-binding protein